MPTTFTCRERSSVDIIVEIVAGEDETNCALFRRATPRKRESRVKRMVVLMKPEKW